MLGFFAPKLYLHVEGLAFVLSRPQLVMRIIHASKEDQERLVDQLVINVEVQHCEVGLLFAKIAHKVNLKVCFYLEELFFTFFGDSNLDIECLFDVS